MKGAVLTISSSRAAAACAPDESGPLLERWIAELGLELAAAEVVRDAREEIMDRLRHWSEAGCALIVTTGGTGFARDDVTPEATLAVCEREAPGIAEALRLVSREHTPHWMLSRGVAAIRGRTLIVNFPGSPAAIKQAAGTLTSALPHALRLLAGEPDRHA